MTLERAARRSGGLPSAGIGGYVISGDRFTPSGMTNLWLDDRTSSTRITDIPKG